MAISSFCTIITELYLRCLLDNKITILRVFLMFKPFFLWLDILLYFYNHEWFFSKM